MPSRRTFLSALIGITLSGTFGATAAISVRHAETPAAVASGRQLEVPSSSLANENAQANAVSCTTRGSCTAVGFFGRSARRPSVALIWKVVGNAWGPGQMVPQPVGASSTSVSTLLSVSCSGPGTCLAVGTLAASTGSPPVLILVRELNGVVQRAVAVAPNDGLSYPNASVWCSPAGQCEIVGSSPNAAGHGRLYTMSASLRQRPGAWHSAPVALHYAAPSGLPTPNNGGSLTLDGFACVRIGNCIAVGALGWNAAQPTLAWTQLQVNGTWRPVRVVALPADALTVGSPDFGAGLSSVACAGSATTIALSQCVAVGSYGATEGQRQLVELITAGQLSLGTSPALPTEGAYATVACRAAILVCTAAGYEVIEGEAGAGSVYSVGTSAGFSSVSGLPVLTGGTDPFDDLGAASCMLSQPECVFVGSGVDEASSPPIEVTVSSLP